MTQPTAEEIIGHMRRYTRLDIFKVVKRTDSKTVDEIVEIICPVPEQKDLHKLFIREMLDEGVIKIATNGKIMMTPKGDEETPKIPDQGPRALTHREAQERFIKSLVRIAKEWHSYKDKSEWKKMEGMIFSILTMIDGGPCAEPGFDLIASQSEDDIEYDEAHGEDWYPVDEPFNDIPMHEIFHDLVRDMRPEGEE